MNESVAWQRGQADPLHPRHPRTDEPAPGVPRVGTRLRDLRSGKGLSLSEAAERSGLSKGFLSRAERDQVSLSVASLMRLCQTLGIEVADLFQTPQGHLVRAADRQRLAFGGTGLTEFQLTPREEQRIQVLLTLIEPGGGSGDEQYTLPVELEFLHVLSGDVTIAMDRTTEVLGAGDSLLFPASVPHAFHNSGPAAASVLWVLSPALPSSPTAPATPGSVPEETQESP